MVRSGGHRSNDLRNGLGHNKTLLATSVLVEKHPAEVMKPKIGRYAAIDICLLEINITSMGTIFFNTIEVPSNRHKGYRSKERVTSLMMVELLLQKPVVYSGTLPQDAHLPLVNSSKQPHTRVGILLSDQSSCPTVQS